MLPQTLEKLGPAFIYYREGPLYFVAEDMETNTHKTFSVSRLESAELLDEKYSAPPVDAKEYFSDAFGVFKGG